MDDLIVWILRICGVVLTLCGLGSLFQAQTQFLGVGMAPTGAGLALAGFGVGAGWLLLVIGMVLLAVGLSRIKKHRPPNQ